MAHQKRNPLLKPARVIVCGGRKYAMIDHIHTVLAAADGLHGPITVITGGAGGWTPEGQPYGADTIAAQWAADKCRPLIVVKAKWKELGRRAGPVRNQLMLEENPNLVIAFPGGKGTADMVRRAEEAGVRVIQAG